VTLSLPVLNAAARVAFVAAGPGKAEVVQRALECQALPGALPAQLVRPAPPGELRWLLDTAAAAQLRTADWAKPNQWPRSEVPAAPKA
jgi:6-phosphogluconolactonase